MGWEVKSAETLQNVSYEKNDEIFETAKIGLKLERLGIPKKSINFFLKIDYSKRILLYINASYFTNKGFN